MHRSLEAGSWPILVLTLYAACPVYAQAVPSLPEGVAAEPVDAPVPADQPLPTETAPSEASASSAGDSPAPAEAAATPVDEEALAEEERAIAAELGALQPQAPTAAAEQPSPTPAPSTSARGLSNTMNPAISAVGLLLGGASTADEPDGERGELETGIAIQEVELRLSSIVDPYFRADLTLAASQEEIGFEEVYLSTLELPQVTVRAGQFRADLGRHNALHTHAFPFLTAPLPWRVLLGAEGLSDPGVSADVLLPLPFFAEFHAQVFRGEWLPFAGHIDDDPATAADDAEPDRRRPEDFVYLGRLQTLLELGAATTLQLGASYAAGRNGFGRRSDIVGADMTVKWRPLEAERYRGLEWQSEYLWVHRAGAPWDDTRGGAYSGLRAQFAQRFWLQARGAVLGLPEDDTPRSYRGEGLVAYVPSEFSALRLQYAYETSESRSTDPVHELFLQAIFSIGPHPPHDY